MSMWMSWNSTNYLIKITKDLLPFQNETLRKKKSIFYFLKEINLWNIYYILVFFSKKKQNLQIYVCVTEMNEYIS